MRIGIDVDNTLNNLSEAIAKQLDIELGVSTLEHLEKDFFIEGITGWTGEEVDEFFGRHLERIFFGADVKDKYMELAVYGLYRRHNELHLVTNRNIKRYDRMEEFTTGWLEARKLKECFKNFHYIKGCKHSYCLTEQLHLDVMVEDNLERSIPFLEAGIPVVLFNYGYNQYDHPLLHRVENWWEAFNVLVKIEREVADRYETVNHYA